MNTKTINFEIYQSAPGIYIILNSDTEDNIVIQYKKNDYPTFAIGGIFSAEEDCQVPDISNVSTEEELFQCSLIWDNSFDINAAIQLQKLLKHDVDSLIKKEFFNITYVPWDYI